MKIDLPERKSYDKSIFFKPVVVQKETKSTKKKTFMQNDTKRITMNHWSSSQDAVDESVKANYSRIRNEPSVFENPDFEVNPRGSSKINDA